MSISVNELFAAAGVTHEGAVPWGTTVPLTKPGVYVVATTPDPAAVMELEHAPLLRAPLDELMSVRPEATVDGAPATVEALAGRLHQMWIPGSPIVYIGLAGTSVRQRMRQYYGTAIGARAPHAGGWPVKMLDSRTLWVHYGASDDPESTELSLVSAFTRAVPAWAMSKLVDPQHPIPFANLMVPRGAKKRHGLAGVKEAKGVSVSRERRVAIVDDFPAPVGASNAASAAVEAPAETQAIPTVVGGGTYWTQKVTVKDVGSGALRVPRSSKGIFPSGNQRISVFFGGAWHDAAWRTGISATGERSGTIRLGRDALTTANIVGGPRRITVVEGGYNIE